MGTKMFFPIHRMKPNCQIIQKGTKFLLFRCFFRYIGRIKIPHFGVFVPVFVPCLSPVCPLPSNLCSRKSGLFRYTGVLEGTKMGTKFVPFVPFCPRLSPFPSNVCLFVRTNLEQVFVFSRKWGLSPKIGPKTPPKWGLNPFLRCPRTPVPTVFAWFLPYPEIRFFRYIGRNKLSDNSCFRAFLPI